MGPGLVAGLSIVCASLLKRWVNGDGSAGNGGHTYTFDSAEEPLKIAKQPSFFGAKNEGKEGQNGTFSAESTFHIWDQTRFPADR